MKAITLWQPWASLIAVGVKRFETRSWPPPRSCLGQRFAIHAAKKPEPRSMAFTVDVEAAIERGLQLKSGLWQTLPFGAVVCTATLVEAYQVRRWTHSTGDIEFSGSVGGSRTVGMTLSSDELLYGDFQQGRWLWEFSDVKRLVPAIPARGMQGIWMWNDADGLAGCATQPDFFAVKG
jgi:activating signal cointegrator 1